MASCASSVAVFNLLGVWKAGVRCARWDCYSWHLPPSGERGRSRGHCCGCGAGGERLPLQQCPQWVLLLWEGRKELPVK